MKCRRFLLALLGTAVMLCGCGSKSSIQVNFEGVVTQVNGSEITLEDTRVIVLSEKTACSGSREFAVGNFVQGHTGDDPDSDRVTADAIYLNIVPQGILARILINYEGTVTAIDGNRLTLDSGKAVVLTEDTVYSIYCGIVSGYYPHVGSHIQGYTEDDPDNPEITAARLHALFF